MRDDFSSNRHFLIKFSALKILILKRLQGVQPLAILLINHSIIILLHYNTQRLYQIPLISYLIFDLLQFLIILLYICSSCILKMDKLSCFHLFAMKDKIIFQKSPTKLANKTWYCTGINQKLTQDAKGHIFKLSYFL